MTSLFYIFILAAAMQGLILAIFIKRVKNNKQSLTFLSPLIAIISFALAARVFYEPSLFIKFAKIAVLSDVILFIYGPLLYFYTTYTYLSINIKPQRLLVHFIPAIVHFAWLSQFLFVESINIPSLLSLKIHQIDGLVTEILGWLHITIYSFFAFRQFFRYLSKAKNFIANLPERNFTTYFFAANFLLLISWAIGFILLHFSNTTVSLAIAYNSIWILLSFNIFLTGYNAIVFPQVFRLQDYEASNKLNDLLYDKAIQSRSIKTNDIDDSMSDCTINVEETPLVIKEKKLPNQLKIISEKKQEELLIEKKQKKFDKEKINTLAKKLEMIMQNEKLFLDSNITLPTLAIKLSASVHYLSKTINNTYNENFYDYINRHRVNYFIGLVQQNKNKEFTILSLAYESGFNSKSAFNAAFKKVAGNTPRAFIKDYQRTFKDNIRAGL